MTDFIKRNTTSINVGWNFYDDDTEYPSIEELKQGDKGIEQRVFDDLKVILNILGKYNLLKYRFIRESGS